MVSFEEYEEKIRECAAWRSQVDQLLALMNNQDKSRAPASLVSNDKPVDRKPGTSTIRDSTNLSVLEKHKINAESRIATLESELSAQRLQTEASESRYAEALKEVTSSKQEIVKLEGKYAAIERQRDAFLSELDEAERDRDLYKAQLESNSNSSNSVVASPVGTPCKACLDRKRTDVISNDNIETIAALRLQLSTLLTSTEEEKRNLTSKLLELETRFKYLKSQTLAREAELAQANVDALAAAKTLWDQQRGELEHQLDIQRSEINELSCASSETKVKVSKPTTFSILPQVPKESRMKNIRMSIGRSSDDSKVDADRRVSDLVLDMNALVKELNALRAKVAVMEAELDSSESREALLNNELHQVKIELFQVLDKVDSDSNLCDNKLVGRYSNTDKVNPLNKTLDKVIGESDLAAINSGLIADMIKLKLEMANLANESDQDRLKMFQMKKLMQKYAERIATLEVKTTQLRH